MWNNLGVFIDHASLANWFYPSMRDLAAVTFNPAWNEAEQCIDGGIRLYSRNDLEWLRTVLDEMLEDQANGLEVPDIGLSAVLYQRSQMQPIDPNNEDGEKEHVTVEVSRVESSDIVFGPGAEGRVREALKSLNQFSVIFGGQLDMPIENGFEASQENQPAASTPPAEGQPSASALPPRQARDGAADGQQQAGVVPLQTQPVDLATFLAAGYQLVPPAREPQTQPPVQAEPSLAEQVAALSQQVNNLAGLLGQQEEESVVEGMGHAPRDNGGGANGIWVGRTGVEQFSGAVDWLFGVDNATPPDPQFRRSDMMYIALTGDVHWRGVFDPDRVMLTGATTVTLPNLAANAMNKVIAAQFSRLNYWRWYESVAVVVPNDGSLHDMQWITYGGSGNLPEVGEKAAYTEGEIGDSKESDPFVTRGRYIGITRRMLKNSDIARIQAVPVALATDAVRTRSSKIAGIFTQNNGVGPTLSDGNTLFHASRNNVAATALGTDTAAWETASEECFAHQEIGSGKAIATFAKLCLVPHTLYFQSLKNFGYGEGQPTSYNPFAVADRAPEDPRPVPVPVPDWSDSNDWSYLADPRIWPVIMMSYSQSPGGGSHPLPELFVAMSETGGLMFTNDSLPVKVRDEWAAGVNGGIGIGKRNVP